MNRACVPMVGLLLWALLPHGRVHACSCGFFGATILWPRDGAQDVALDSTLVLMRHEHERDTERLIYRLVDGDGREVELQEVRRLEQPYSGCRSNEELFLRAPDGLQPETRYQLSVEFPPGDEAANAPSTSFSTAPADREATTRVEVTPLQAKVTVMEVVDLCDEPPCEALAALRLELRAPLVSPIFVDVQSGARDGFNRDRFGLVPADWQESTFVAPTSGEAWVPLTDDDRCIELRVFGFDGSLLLEQQRCEPDRCAISDSRFPGVCGGAVRSSVEIDRLARNSCDDPPVLQKAPDGSLIYPAEGCSISPRGRGPGLTWIVGSLVLGLLMARRRARHG